jgi:predicted nucleotidyltransferase
MIKVNDEVKQLARALADWAADKSVTVFLFGSRVRGDHRPARPRNIQRAKKA